MALADFQPAKQSVHFKGGSFDVRGLSLDDMGVLMKHYLDDLDSLFELYSKNINPDLAVSATAQYAVALVREAPAMVAHLICLASDAPEALDKARLLPMPVQVEALKTILTLTFEEAGGAKKFYESLLSLWATGTANVSSATMGSLT